MRFNEVKQFVQEPWAFKWQSWYLPHDISLVKQSVYLIWTLLISFLNSLFDLFTMHIHHAHEVQGVVLRDLLYTYICVCIYIYIYIYTYIYKFTYNNPTSYALPFSFQRGGNWGPKCSVTCSRSHSLWILSSHTCN